MRLLSFLLIFALVLVSAASAQELQDQNRAKRIIKSAFQDQHSTEKIKLAVKLSARTSVRFIFHRSEWQGQVGALLLSGRSYSVSRDRSRKGRYQRAWASGFVNGKSIELTFPIRTKNAAQFYKIEIPLDSGKGEIHRAPSFALAGKECGNPHTTTALASDGASGSYFSSELTTAPLVLRELEFAADADSQYHALFGTEATSRMASVINATSAIYESQLGIRIFQKRLNVQTSSTIYDGDYPVPGNSTPPLVYRLLYQFTDYNNLNRVIGVADAYMLFSGKNYENGVIGLAFTGNGTSASPGHVCINNDYAYAVVHRVTDPADPIVVAHELGHNFNAQHDTGVMSAAININSPATNFSGTSLSQIQTHVTNHGSCLATVSVTPTPNSTPTPIGTPPATPTPQPTSTPSGGGGSPISGGGPPLAPAIGLTAAIRGASLIGYVSLPSSYVGCTVNIRAGTTYHGARRGRRIGGFTVNTGISTIFSQTLRTRVRPLVSRDPRRVYFVAEHVCSGFTSTFSASKRVNPHRVGVRTQTSLSRWLRALAVNF